MPQGSWDDERHRKLLLAILADQPRLDFESISKNMGDGTKAASIREHIRQLKIRVESAKNTPGSSPAKKEKPTKPKVTRAKADKAQSGAKRRRTSSDIAALGWGYLSDDVDVEYSEAGTPSKESKIKNEPVDDTQLNDQPEFE
ncbi:uncharacterized protein N7446_003771 [Penicillium canescens]|uniref:Uncharacterized protein n=1 Tax=Penicillium canescens TaxID=5083 RepID=A0AAD6I3F7_PENCN|nr:uncharacterized protein N7446_003771 [Penicillium canescens]KAJ6027633.1 hypothetical protein N7460_012450 [Penicillium canescens]KAJ6040911.1 hypothetical protein N7444_009816 [Penicillium canescens]KAJ6066734.1 hypothetical protein N7446_003771 [Penicillium canescens]